MKRFILLSWTMILIQIAAQAQVNRLAAIPLQIRSQAGANEKKIVKVLVHLTKEHIAQKEFYQVLSNKQIKAAFRRAKVDMRDINNLKKRSNALAKISSRIDYLIYGEIMIVGSQIRVATQFFRTKDGKMFKSAAAAGYRDKLKSLAIMISKKLMPKEHEILKEIDILYKKAYANKNYDKAIQLASWAIQVEPRAWKLHYRRAEAYETDHAYIKAEQDYSRAVKINRRASRKIGIALKRIQPRIIELKNNRKHLLKTIYKTLERVEQESGHNIKVYGTLIHEIRKMQPNNAELTNTANKAGTLVNLLKLLKKNVHLAQLQGPSKKNNQDLRFLLNKIKEVNIKAKQIAKYLGQGFEKSGKIYFQKAKKRYMQNKFKQASVLLDRAILLMPSSVQVYYWRGLTFEKLKNFKASIYNLSKAIQLSSTYFEAYFQRATIYIYLKDWARAQNDLQTAAKLNSGSAQTYFLLGRVYTKQQKFAQAIKCYSRALEINERHVMAYMRRGRLYDRSRQYLKAHNDYQKALQLAPHLRAKIRPLFIKVSAFIGKDANIYEGKGKVFLETGEPKIALRYFKKAVKLAPHNPYLHFYLGRTFHALQNYEQALKSYSHALEIKRSKDLFFFYRAISYEKMGKHTQALADLAKTVKINPGYHAAHYRRGMIFEKIKKYKKAVSNYKLATENYKAKPFYYFDLARVYEILGQHGQATSAKMRGRELQKK